MISPALFALAYALDWLIGDPVWLPHPVRWMGLIIRVGERPLRRFAHTPRGEFVAGLLLTIVVVGVFGAGSWRLLFWLRVWNPTLAFVVSVYLVASTLATRSLLDEARAVRRFLVNGDLHSARTQVGRIVGRDTHNLDESEVTRAAIETLAENASDGIVAPMFYLAIGGVPAAMAYKAINTLDSAGALGIRLGGTNFYDGEAHEGQYLGDAHRPLDQRALRNALRLTVCVSLLMFGLCLSVRVLVSRW